MPIENKLMDTEEKNSLSDWIDSIHLEKKVDGRVSFLVLKFMPKVACVEARLWRGKFF